MAKKLTTKKEEKKTAKAKTTTDNKSKTSKVKKESANKKDAKPTKKRTTNKVKEQTKNNSSKNLKKSQKKTTTNKKTTTKKQTRKKEPEVIVAGKITIKRPKKKTDPYIITTATGLTITGYSPEEMEEFKEIIINRRDEIIKQLKILKEQMMDPNTGEYVNENSPYSLHMAEQGTDAQEREKLFLWAQRESKFLRYLEDALKRIEIGTYGICVDCIDEPKKLCSTCPLIPKERLRAVPHTQHCVQVKQQVQK